MSILVKVVSVLVVIGSYFVDGPMPPPLDFMLRVFGFRMIPAGVEQVWPLLLEHTAPPEEALSWIFEWLSIENNPVLGGLILGLTSWAVMSFYGRIHSLGGRAKPSDLKRDAEYNGSLKSNPCPEEMPSSSGTNVSCQNRHLMNLRSQCFGIHDSLMKFGSSSDITNPRLC